MLTTNIIPETVTNKEYNKLRVQLSELFTPAEAVGDKDKADLEAVDPPPAQPAGLNINVILLVFAVLLVAYNSETTNFLDKFTFSNPLVFSIVKIVVVTLIFTLLYKLTLNIK